MRILEERILPRHADVRDALDASVIAEALKRSKTGR
jgi:hypothetical protein